MKYNKLVLPDTLRYEYDFKDYERDSRVLYRFENGVPLLKIEMCKLSTLINRIQ